MYLFYFDIHCSSELFFKVDQIRVVINAIDHRSLSKEKNAEDSLIKKQYVFNTVPIKTEIYYNSKSIDDHVHAH